MAGKYHKDFVRYRDGGGVVLQPGDKRVRSYSEGYQARRKGAAKASNPFVVSTDQQSNYWVWDQGWRDADGLFPATHVGKPDVTVPLP
jgi:ribosome modulation factor